MPERSSAAAPTGSAAAASAAGRGRRPMEGQALLKPGADGSADSGAPVLVMLSAARRITADSDSESDGPPAAGKFYLTMVTVTVDFFFK